MEAAKRLGLAYVAVAAGASAAVLAERLADTGVAVLVTSHELEPTARAANAQLELADGGTLPPTLFLVRTGERSSPLQEMRRRQIELRRKQLELRRRELGPSFRAF